jgi:hypothetical protein
MAKSGFLRINDFKKDFEFKVNEMIQEHELHQKQIQALRLLEQKEDQLHKKHPTYKQNAKSNFKSLLQKIKLYDLIFCCFKS